MTEVNTIIQGDIRDVAKQLPDESVHCIVTSPPYYGLRDYQTAQWIGGDSDCDHSPCRQNPTSSSSLATGKATTGHQHEGFTGNVCPKCGAKRIDKQIGLESTPEEYVQAMVEIFRELRRVLRNDGTVWLILGDSYASDSKWGGATGSKHANGLHGNTGIGRQKTKANLPDKNLIGIPWRVALALQSDGWWIRSDIIWSKPNPMPESVKDRPTKSHEYVFLLTKSPRYFYDQEAIRDAVADSTIGRGSVWEVATTPYPEAHFACFPPALIEPCILAGCPAKVCAKCGAPWVRLTESGFTDHDGETDSQYQAGSTAKRLAHLRQAAREAGSEYVNHRRTIGFEPTCNCNAGTTPGIVLDPFIGSGTTAEVAVKNGRNWLGVELNPDYIELAYKRLRERAVQPPLLVIGADL